MANEIREAYLDLLSADEQDEEILEDFIKGLEKRLKKFETKINDLLKGEVEKAGQSLTKVALQTQNSGLRELTSLVSEAKQELKAIEIRLQEKFDTKDKERTTDSQATLNRFQTMKFESGANCWN